MRTALTFVCLSVSGCALVYALANPANGLALHDPVACLGLLAIGVGLCRHLRDRRLALARQRA
jgi:hypothetical protein